jgi:hypothetical protein
VRYLKRSSKRAAVSIGALLGYLEVVRLLERVKEKEREKHIWVLFLGPRGHNILSLGAIWNFSKEQRSTELVWDCGAQGACLWGLGSSGT